MKSKRKRIFIVVAEIKSRRVHTIIEGPHENEINDDVRSQTVMAKTRELANRFSPLKYDIMITRALNLEHLKDCYPEFSGWDRVQPEPLM